ARPNGIALSPDERTLYVANSDGDRPVIMAYPLKSDNTVDTGREFFNAKTAGATGPGACDGMKVDAHGNLWATIPGGLAIFPPPNVTALSPNERTLYVPNSDGDRPVIRASPLKSDNTVDTGREFFNAKTAGATGPGACDGMKVDAHGNLWATIPGGLAIFTPE